MRIALALVLGVVLAGCSSTRTVYVTSEPSGAEVCVNEWPAGKTPCKAEVPESAKGDAPKVRVTLKGYQDFVTSFDQKVTDVWVIFPTQRYAVPGSLAVTLKPEATAAK